MTTRDQYIRNQKIIQNRMVQEFTPKVYAALQSQIDDAIQIIREKGLVGAQGNITNIFDARIGKVVTELYRTAAKQAKKKYRINKKGFGFTDIFIDGVMDFFARYLLNKVVLPISTTTVKFINQVLEQAIANGWGVDQTVKELETANLTKVRARTIVRTETVRATNFTQLAAADDEDYEVEKTWIAIEDKRTRVSHSHAGVDGEVRDLYEPFGNGLMFPGDPEGGAAEVCNCRCTLGYNIKRDLSGRKIPKKNPGLNLLSRLNLGRAA